MGDQAVLVEREALPVMFKRVADEPDAISRGMAEVEEAVGLADRPTFERLAQRADRDGSRPGIEFYRRETVIDLLLPILTD